ncbi:hypothetical protein [Gemmatimonas sp.]|uniref:hypothetical protein n=1 Tax=Gemmatimonas sp. TaxID=1962908 RepID=UPI00398328A5
MDTGSDFLRAQLNNAISQHHALVVSVRDHAEQADDPEYRRICERHLPGLENHQEMLQAYGTSIGSEGGSGLKNILGSALGKARDAVDAMRGTDFLRVVGDIVLIRQAQDTFATFAIAGERLGDARLAELGRMGEKEHDAVQREFNAFCADSFVQHVQGTMATGRGDRESASASTSASARM